MDREPIEVGIRAFRARLSEYIRKVRKGRVIVLTDRGEPVGRLLPASASSESDMVAMLQAGMLSWSGRRLKRRKPGARSRGTRTVSDLLIADR